MDSINKKITLNTIALLSISSVAHATPLVSVNSNELMISTPAGSPVYAQIVDDVDTRFDKELSSLPNGMFNSETLATCSASCILYVDINGENEATIKVTDSSHNETVYKIKNDNSEDSSKIVWQETFDNVIGEYSLDSNGMAALLPAYPATYTSSFYVPQNVTVQDITGKSPTSTYPNQYIPEHGQSSDILHGGTGEDSSNIAMVFPVSGSTTQSSITIFSLSNKLYSYLENNQNYNINMDLMRSNIEISPSDDILSTLSIVKNKTDVICTQNLADITSWVSMPSCSFKYQDGDEIGLKISYPALPESSITKSAFGLIVDNMSFTEL
ncbi:TPA: hypothetical protein ACN37W_003758 [Vibrio parahaemolyticus]